MIPIYVSTVKGRICSDITHREVQAWNGRAITRLVVDLMGLDKLEPRPRVQTVITK